MSDSERDGDVNVPIDGHRLRDMRFQGTLMDVGLEGFSKGENESQLSVVHIEQTPHLSQHLATCSQV